MGYGVCVFCLVGLLLVVKCVCFGFGGILRWVCVYGSRFGLIC